MKPDYITQTRNTAINTANHSKLLAQDMVAKAPYLAGEAFNYYTKLCGPMIPKFYNNDNDTTARKP